MLLPLLHSGDVAPGTPFLLAWHFPPLLTLSLLAAGMAYAWGVDRLKKVDGVAWPGWYIASFYAGLFAAVVSLLGPVDTFNDELFSLHTVQHLIMMLIAAPLLVLGRPVQLALRALPRRTSRRILQQTIGRRSVRGLLTFLALPITVGVLYNGTMALWHIPALYDSSVRSEAVHTVMHATFFGTALLFWWLIIDPVPRHHRFSTAITLVQLAIAMLVGKILGGIFTFAPSMIYESYDLADQPWGLTPIMDQQLGGVIMLVGGLMVYATLFFVILAKALVNAEKRQTASERRTPAPNRKRQPVLSHHSSARQHQVSD